MIRAHFLMKNIIFSLKILQSLALCTALMMFMLSRDRLNMDLDKSSLNLMLRLMEVDNQNNDGGMTAAGKRALNRNIERAKEVYFQLQKEEGKENQTDLESVSVSQMKEGNINFQWSISEIKMGQIFKKIVKSKHTLY